MTSLQHLVVVYIWNALSMDPGLPLIIEDNQGRVATGSAIRLVSFLFL